MKRFWSQSPTFYQMKFALCANKSTNMRYKNTVITVNYTNSKSKYCRGYIVMAWWPCFRPFMAINGLVYGLKAFCLTLNTYIKIIYKNITEKMHPDSSESRKISLKTSLTLQALMILFIFYLIHSLFQYSSVSDYRPLLAKWFIIEHSLNITIM